MCDSFSLDFQVLLWNMLKKEPSERPTIEQILEMDLFKDTETGMTIRFEQP